MMRRPAIDEAKAHSMQSYGATRQKGQLAARDLAS
jgi:hypothetical protein